VTGKFLDLLWTPEVDLVGIVLHKCSSQPVLMRLPLCGSYMPGGTLTSNALDSGIMGCVWDSVRLDATIPAGTVIEVTTQTSDTPWAADAPFQPDCSAYSPTSLACPISLAGSSTESLVQSAPGRYLRLNLALKTNGLVSPLLTGVQVSFPRSSYLQYLPALYQQDDRSRVFLDRFLRIFQTTFDGMDRTLDTMWTLFDPLSVPDSWFAWLAAWLALPINPLWTDQERRTALKSAGQLYPQRGTPTGVQQLVQQYSGVSVRLIEHFRLRQLIILSDAKGTGQTLGRSARLWSRDHYSRLQLGVYSRVGYFDLTGAPEPDIEPLAWGANEFTVFFDCHPYAVASTQKKVTQAVEQEKPAYTKANYAPVLPRMRVGVQATLGVDTRIGEHTAMLLGTTGTLDYDSILSCSKTESRLQREQTSPRPQVDMNTRLM
jgi:phage tail-like protein